MKKMHLSTRTIAYTAVMTALVTIATLLLKVQTADSFTNLGDSIIFLTAAFFGPLPATLAGGIGSFLADLISYPATMWYTLLIKGLEGLIAGSICLLANKIYAQNSNKAIKYVLYFTGMIIAALWMATCYFICNSYFYGTKESAMTALPMDFIQGGVSIALAIPLYFALLPAVEKLSKKTFRNNRNTNNNHKELTTSD